MEFLEFKKGKQTEFLRSVKLCSRQSWQKLARDIRKSRSSIFAYLREEQKIPKDIAEKWAKKYEFPLTEVKVISLQNQPQIIKKPRISYTYAEFLGALAGDGHLHKKPAELSITCNRHDDKEYILYLCKLFIRLFGKEPTIVYQNNTIKLRLYSKELVTLLNKEFEFPIGKKKNRLKIPPKVVKGRRAYLINFIRGVFDTDGTICRHHKNSGAIMEISSRDTFFLAEINEKLKRLGLKTSLGYKGVRIYDKKEIDKFYRMIKPSNPKHKRRYETFKKSGTIPKYLSASSSAAETLKVVENLGLPSR